MREAKQKPRHLRETGRVAFCQAQSDNGVPTISDTEAYKGVSRDVMASLMKEGGQVRRMKTNLGRDKLEQQDTFHL